MHDYVIGSYEGPVGGPIACTEVHTLFTETPPEHFGLTECLRRLIGKIYIEGAALSEIQENIDVMCTSLGSCTYEQRQAIAGVKAVLEHAKVLLPREVKP